MIDTKELRGKLFELHAQYESKYGIQTVKNKDIGYEDGGFKVLKAYMKIRDEFLDNVMKLFDSELDRLYAHEKETTPFASRAELEKALEEAMDCTAPSEFTSRDCAISVHFRYDGLTAIRNINTNKNACVSASDVTPSLLKALGVVK